MIYIPENPVLILFFFVYLTKSSYSKEKEKESPYLIQIEENIRFEYIGSPAIELRTEENNGKKEYSHISDQSLDLGKFTDQIETEKKNEWNERIKKSERKHRGSIRSIARIARCSYAHKRIRGATIYLSAEKCSDKADDGCEKEGEDNSVDVFPWRYFESLKLENKHYHESENPSHKGKIIIGHKEEFQYPLAPKELEIAPLGDDIEKPRENEHRKKKPEDVSEEKIRIDPEFFRKPIEHEEKKDEWERKRQPEGIDGYSKDFYLRIHIFLLKYKS